MLTHQVQVYEVANFDVLKGERRDSWIISLRHKGSDKGSPRQVFRRRWRRAGKNCHGTPVVPPPLWTQYWFPLSNLEGVEKGEGIVALMRELGAPKHCRSGSSQQ